MIFLFLSTSHVPLIHTVAQRTSKTQLKKVSAQKWQAYLKVTPIWWHHRLSMGLSENPLRWKHVLKWSRAADHSHRRVISFVWTQGLMVKTAWHWTFSDWWNCIDRVPLMQSSLIMFSYVCFAVIKPRRKHARKSTLIPTEILKHTFCFRHTRVVTVKKLRKGRYLQM